MKRAATMIAWATVVLSGLAASNALAFPVFAGSRSASGGTSYTTKRVTFQSVGGARITCLSYETVDALRGEAALRVNVVMYSCTHGTEVCHSIYPYNEQWGEIDMELYGSLVYLNQAHHKVGVRWSFYGGELRVECKLTGTWTVVGEALTPITPVNRVVNPGESFNTPLTEHEGVQSPSTYGGSETITPELVPPGAASSEPAGIALPLRLYFNEPVEIAG